MALTHEDHETIINAVAYGLTETCSHIADNINHDEMTPDEVSDYLRANFGDFIALAWQAWVDGSTRGLMKKDTNVSPTEDETS